MLGSLRRWDDEPDLNSGIATPHHSHCALSDIGSPLTYARSDVQVYATRQYLRNAARNRRPGLNSPSGGFQRE